MPHSGACWQPQLIIVAIELNLLLSKQLIERVKLHICGATSLNERVVSTATLTSLRRDAASPTQIVPVPTFAGANVLLLVFAKREPGF